MPTLTQDEYKGQVLLIVNLASACGYTPQYLDLQVSWDQWLLMVMWHLLYFSLELGVLTRAGPRTSLRWCHHVAICFQWCSPHQKKHTLPHALSHTQFCTVPLVHCVILGEILSFALLSFSSLFPFALTHTYVCVCVLGVQSIYDKYKSKKFQVLGFPCNQVSTWMTKTTIITGSSKA